MLDRLEGVLVGRPDGDGAGDLLVQPDSLDQADLDRIGERLYTVDTDLTGDLLK